MFEDGYRNETLEFLKGRKHDLVWTPVANSSAQAIRVVDGRFEAEGEPRQRNSGGVVI